MGLSSFYYKTNTKISRAIGLRDPECGCSLSPSVFLRQGAREIMAGLSRRSSSSSSSRPVRRHDRNRG